MSQKDAERAGTTSAADRPDDHPPANGRTGQSAADTAADTAHDLEDRTAELEDRWRRTAAELENFRKRTARESAGQRDDERARVLARWLPVVDNLELALQHAGPEAQQIVEGIEAVRNQALAVLAEYGYPRFDDVGKVFDPKLHDAVGTVASPDSEPGTVVHVVRPRYGDGDKVLRPAGVIVATEER
ncbi:nucleotide exchange factor GrpE [Kribbella sp. NPDC051137]|uniref:nucleotide exchange factor GrpE n=1 Tax=Kribbella sp. NPDC051137 TaxID=3155045 RepID=UPI00341E4284